MYEKDSNYQPRILSLEEIEAIQPVPLFPNESSIEDIATILNDEMNFAIKQCLSLSQDCTTDKIIDEKKIIVNLLNKCIDT